MSSVRTRSGRDWARRWLVPPIRSERHAMHALIAGFLLEAGSEIYQFVTTAYSIPTSGGGYYLSLATSILGFYFFWRGMREWNRLGASPPKPARRPVPWVALAILVGGVAATALWNVALGTVGAGSSPAPLAWLVGGAFVLAVGSFFLTLRRLVAPFQRAPGRVLGWASFVWSLGISTVAGLALGQAIVRLFVDFFTSWPALIQGLAPFVFAVSPLYVAFGLITLAYADAYRRAPNTPPAPAATGVSGA
jgi:hypothetical protein